MTIADKQKHLIRLLADGQFHSGADLALALGISRAAVCRQVHALAGLGLHVAAVTGKGYRLEQPIELLEAAAIGALLTPAARKALAGLRVFDQIDSTNRYLAGLGAAAPSGLACLAEHQTAGRGRRGRVWVSPFGGNLCLSVLWRFEQGYARTGGLSLAMGVAVMRALREAGAVGVGLKWPNDLCFAGKKLGGILVEMAGEANGPCQAVVGIGLNLRLSAAQAAAIDQPWVDLGGILGRAAPGRNRLVAAVLSHVLAVLVEFADAGVGAVVDEWRGYDCLAGRAACLHLDNRRLAGRVLGVDDGGLLLFELGGGEVRAFAAGEVSFHGPG